MDDLAPDTLELLHRCRAAEVPNATSRRRVWLRLAKTVAVGGSVLGSAGTAVGAGAATSSPAVGAALGKTASVAMPTALGIAKLVVLGGLVGATATATLVALEERRPAPERASPVSTAYQLPHQHSEPPVEPPPAEYVRKVEKEPPPPPAASFVASPAASKPPSLVAETQRLEAAQRALGSGQPAVALAELDRYEREHPGGVLGEEAAATRVLALCSVRDVDTARVAAQSFEKRFPHSPLLPSVRRACTEPTIR